MSFVTNRNRLRSGDVSGGALPAEPDCFLWEELANAIILLAVKDYRKALRILRRYPESEAWKKEKNNCERFFRSWWFSVLTTADPAALMDGIRKEVLQ